MDHSGVSYKLLNGTLAYFMVLFPGLLTMRIQEGILEEKTVSQGFNSPREIMSDSALNWLTELVLFFRRPPLNRSSTTRHLLCRSIQLR